MCSGHSNDGAGGQPGSALKPAAAGSASQASGLAARPTTPGFGVAMQSSISGDKRALVYYYGYRFILLFHILCLAHSGCDSAPALGRTSLTRYPGVLAPASARDPPTAAACAMRATD